MLGDSNMSLCFFIQPVALTVLFNIFYYLFWTQQYEHMANARDDTSVSATEFSASCFLKMLESQSDALHNIADRQEAIVGSLSRLYDVLERMDNRQAATDESRPIPQIPATSASAWNALLKQMMENTVNPAVERWRGSLDTLLIFIALFSAIVTAFYIQTSTNLSSDSGFQTNILLTNLTEIIISLHAGVNASLLTFQPPVSFKPDPAAVRQNFYWSTSLVLSISVAILAVICRAHLLKLTRSRRKEAHKKLAEIHDRFREAERLLGRIVESLPQALIVAVAVFIVGVLDSIFSVWKVSPPRSRLVLGTFVSALSFVAATSLVIAFTVFHGCLHYPRSPFHQTEMVRTVLVSASKLVFEVLSWVANRDTNSQYWHWRRRTLGHYYTWLTKRDQEVYHAVLQATHDDHALDYAAAALLQLTQEDMKFVIVTNPLETEVVVDSLVFLLSSESSFRSNHTAAAVVLKLFGPASDLHTKARLSLAEHNNKRLQRALGDAGIRYSAAATGRPYLLLWKSLFTQALAALLTRGLPVTERSITTCAPALLLICDAPRNVTLFALRVLNAQVEAQVASAKWDFESALSTEDRIADFEAILEPFSAVLQEMKPSMDMKKICSSVIDIRLSHSIAATLFAEPSLHLLTHFPRWFGKRAGWDFIHACLDYATEQPLRPKDALRVFTDVLYPTIVEISDLLSSNGDPQRSHSLVLHLASFVKHLQISTYTKSEQVNSIILLASCEYEGGDSSIQTSTHPLQFCDLFCLFAPSVLELLAQLHPHTGEPYLNITSSEWKTLSDSTSPISSPANELVYWAIDPYFRRLNDKGDVPNQTPIKHRNEVRARLLEGFRPFFADPDSAS